jgi:hypothetical protein
MTRNIDTFDGFDSQAVDAMVGTAGPVGRRLLARMANRPR